ncbi:hypothetical protein BCR42DRAFT_445434 [Absidia repens]|uniref:Uncharacterized protein n=1 Tax=Absidia repens TaxID=90262 RepID=A0A1X2J368_9FUNG|nr:hypothetical protein BCR42DRAFT_445434 [Absidia repens]
MDLKTDLQRWHKACQAFDIKDYVMSLDTLLVCFPSSKIYFNIGIIMVTLHDHQHALEVFAKAIELDPYFSAAYFQSGVSNIMLGEFRQAVKCFDLAYKNLRGNKAINYRQLGLDFTLYACEILYNRGMCQIYLDNAERGMADLNQAQQLKMNDQHRIIDQATHDRERSTFGVYSIPSTVIYRPTECQLQLLEGIDSLLSTCDNCSAKRLLILDQHHQHHQHHPYHHIPKYLSKYLRSVINTKNKASTAVSKSASPSMLSHHLHSFPPTPLSRNHTPLSYLLTSSYQQRKKQHLMTFPRNSVYYDGGYQDKSKTRKKCAYWQQPTHQRNSILDNNCGKYKLKLHYQDTRILMIDANITYQDVLLKVYEKLELPTDGTNKLDGLKLHCMDSDGVLSQLMNEQSWSSVKWINTYRDPRQLESNTKTPCIGKIEIWCKF